MARNSSTVSATDSAGNTRSITASYTVTAADATPPVITPTIDGTLGSNGWYTSNVSLSWTVTDPESAVGSPKRFGPASVTVDTAGMTFTCSATSGGGSSSKSVTIKRDAHPSDRRDHIADGRRDVCAQSAGPGGLHLEQRALRRVASCSGPVANGAAINTSSTGTKWFAVNAVDQAGDATVASLSYAVSGSTPSATAGTRLLAWNDLGMHCADSDFSVFTLLPPFNNLNAQLVVGGKLVEPQTGYTLTYESAPDPATGSINTSSSGKTNFWTFVAPLFGPTTLPPDSA